MQHKVDFESNNQTLSVSAGDTIAITLHETLTAGYEWAVDSLTGDCCQLQSSAYSINAGAAVGGSGARKMIFLINKKGNGKIILKNHQRWSGDIDKTFTLGINAA